VEDVRLPESLFSSPLEGVERLLVEAQGRVQVSLRMEGEAEVVEGLGLLVEAAEAALEGQRLPLRRGSAGRIAHGRAGEADAAPGRRLPGLVPQPGEELQRLLIELQRRFRLAEGGVDPAQREPAPRLLLPSSQRAPVAGGLRIAGGGEPLAFRAPLAVARRRLGHQPLGLDTLALGGRRRSELLQTDGVRPGRDSRARRQHPDLQRARRLRREQGGFRAFAVRRAVHRDQGPSVRLPHLHHDVDTALIDGYQQPRSGPRLDAVGVGLSTRHRPLDRGSDPEVLRVHDRRTEGEEDDRPPKDAKNPSAHSGSRC